MLDSTTEARTQQAYPMAMRPWILLVEDHPDTVAFMTARLTEAGFAVEVARHDEELDLALSGAWLPDVVLMDINLPRIDGDQLVERMRQDTRTRGLPVIFVTADSAQRVAHLLDSHTTLCLEKPLSSRVLLAAIDRVLECRLDQPGRLSPT